MKKSIENIIYKLKGAKSTDILKNRQIIQWVYGDLSYLKEFNKIEESKWGVSMCKQYSKCYKKGSIWTGTLGELIVYSILDYMNKNPYVIVENSKNGLSPDFQTIDKIVEVKTSSYSGQCSNIYNALAIPYKYAEIPNIYNKPLDIVCVGHVESIANSKFNLLGTHSDNGNRKLLLDFYKKLGINFVGCRELLDKL